MGNTASKIDWNSSYTKKHLKEAKDAGLTLIGPGSDSKHRTYVFNACKHEQEIQTDHVRNYSFSCQTCLQNKLKQEAKDAGLTLIGPGRDKDYRTYVFNACKHEQEITTDHVRKYSFSCQTCLQNKLKQEAKDAGLTLIGPGSDRNHRTYVFNACKHEQEITTGNVRNYNFRCQTCEETSLDLPCKVYLLEITANYKKDSMTWLKLGYSNNVDFRVKSYGLPEDAVLKKLKIINFETGRQAQRYESFCHKKFKGKRLPAKQMKYFHKKNGFEECYPVRMSPILITELNNKEKRIKVKSKI